MNPKVLLLDEITSALDPELVGEVLNVVRELAADGMTMLLVTHEMSFARDVSARVVFMDAGRVAVQGTPREVFSGQNHDRLRSFLSRIEMRGSFNASISTERGQGLIDHGLGGRRLGEVDIDDQRFGAGSRSRQFA